MRIALYRARFGNAVDHLIDLLSGRRGFSHCELIFNDWRSFSSTTRDPSFNPATGQWKSDGCRWKEIDYQPDHWGFAEFNASDEQHRAMRAEADAMLSCRYDYAGVTHFCLPFWREHEDEYFCSEAVLTVLAAGGMLTHLKPALYSPNSLAELLGVL